MRMVPTKNTMEYRNDVNDTSIGQTNISHSFKQNILMIRIAKEADRWLIFLESDA